MCGIAGSIKLPQFDTLALERALHHRGPNGSGSFSYEELSLFHARLSIQDLSTAASQPMTRGNLTIVFNGEIYNHLELRAKVPAYHFSTTSDTETLLALFENFGTEALSWCDGMFALAIYDSRHDSLLLARDRMGKKPLFCYEHNGSFAFASELNALLRIAPLEVDYESLSVFVRCGFFPDDGAPYHHVRSLPAGSYALLDVKNPILKPVPYFDLLSLYKAPKIATLEESLELLEGELMRAVRLRLESSDLEVGSFLSGGIDSSLVTAMAAQMHPGLKSFTVAFSGAYDESPLALLTATKYGTNHATLEIDTSALRDDIWGILGAYGRPFMDSSAIPSFYVSKEAKKHLSVILNGDGADELFGGYRRYVPIKNGWLKLARIFAPLMTLLPMPRDKKSPYSHIYRLLSMSGKSGLDFYLSATIDSFEDSYTFAQNRITDALNNKIALILNDESLTPLSQILYLDAKNLLLSDLLPKMDIATMAHSLEGRSPFLSQGIVELAPRIQDGYKISGKNTKFILRTLAKKYLPSEILTQPKRGFEVPLKSWVNNELKEPIFDTLSSKGIAREIVESTFVDELLLESWRFAPEKRAKMLYTLFALEVWHSYYERNHA